MSNRKKTAVVLFQLGGPDSLEAVEPFLYNLFCDPDIIDIPGAFLFRKSLAKLVSSLRAPKVRELYRNIGGRSPILPQTEEQAESLKSALQKRGISADVLIAMRYWNPTTKDVIENLRKKGIEEVVLLPLYPHFSRATTGSSVNEWKRVVKHEKAGNISTRLVNSYYAHPLYIEAIVGNVKRAIECVPADERKHIQLVFSAHGTPLKLVRDGDPYSEHIRATYELVIEKGNFGLPHCLCFQSKVGPQKWLEPSLTQTLERLGREKASHVIVIPVAFVTEHIETLSEINIEAREEAHNLGIGYFEMMPALIANEKFIECLTDLVVKELQN